MANKTPKTSATKTPRPSTSTVQFNMCEQSGQSGMPSYISVQSGRESFISTTIQSPQLRPIDKCVQFCCPNLSKRYTVALLASMGFFISFGIRCNLGVAIAKMVKFDPDIKNSWIQWLVTSSYFAGYFVTQIPGGLLAARYPANRVFGAAIFCSAVLNMVVPAAARGGWVMLLVVRTLHGLVDGVTLPACHEIWKRWAPPLERSQLATLALCGSYGGTAAGFPISAWLVERFSWIAPYYFYGCAGIVWYFAWLWLAGKEPAKDPTITARELSFIEKSIGPVSSSVPTIRTTPWRQIFRSKPVYAIIVASFCHSWTFQVVVYAQVTYLGEQHTPTELMLTIVVPIGGILADYFRQKKIMTTTQVRKASICIGFGMETFFLFLVVVSTDIDFGLICLCLSVGISGIAISGFYVNPLDIAPRYAGTLLGISNSAGMLSSWIAPKVFRWVAKHGSMPLRNWFDERGKVFLLVAFIHICGVSLYSFFASGELQPWAEPSRKSAISESQHEASSV